MRRHVFALAAASALCLAMAQNHSIPIANSTAQQARAILVGCVTPDMGRGVQHIHHGHTEYLFGSYYRAGSIYRVCRDGALVCYEDNGMADGVDDPTDCRNAAVKRRLGLSIDPTVIPLWPESTLCYKLDETYSDDVVTVIHAGLDHIRSSGVVRILSVDECNEQDDKEALCGGCEDYMYVENKGKTCSATVGYQAKGPQNLHVAEAKCFKKGFGTFVHEVFHALGVYHEQVHPHAKSIVLADEIPAGAEKNYLPKAESVYMEFDAASIMHYSVAVCLPKPEFQDTTFCTLATQNDDDCVTPTREHCDDDASKVLGNRKAMTDLDRETMEIMYAPEHRIFDLQKEQHGGDDDETSTNNQTKVDN
ncbi:Aste57867_23622 [Aphanomyces stellatus]|uniref:Aste57867_23622 protein n=1 Tax=Aphanomyces stellatus TaxID=120398 RepID=A0A485LP09_9STRA|nr:hypothetical protein As57867_023550 [Aphanomyces stellatus]VFU00267.1 Aste57867_23622 [Aphanomyces stellatus]